MIELLTVHTYIENEIMYPRVRALVPELEDDILESFEEHHVADVLVMERVPMMPSDERFEAKTTVLIENVLHAHRGGGRRVVPEGARGSGPQRAPGHRRRDGRGEEACAAPPGAAERPEEVDRRRHLVSARLRRAPGPSA